MKRKTMTTGLLAMGIVIALATLGLVVGNWAQSLSINGNVQTGNLGARIESKLTADNDPKDVATCTSSNDAEGTKVSVQITNAYPGYQCHFWTNVINTDKLPISVSAVPKNISAGLTLIRSDDIPANAGEPTDPKGDCTADQLLAGEVEYCDWDVVVDKSVAQGATLGFDINICAGLVMPGSVKGCAQ